METQGKFSVLATKAVETQGKGSVFAAKAVETQGKGVVFAAKAVETQGKRCCRYRGELLAGGDLKLALQAEGGRQRELDDVLDRSAEFLAPEGSDKGGGRSRKGSERAVEGQGEAARRAVEGQGKAMRTQWKVRERQ